jgi:hypothetical protein
MNVYYYVAKIALTLVIVLGVAEVSKRSGFWAAVFASLPLTSLLAFTWIYFDTHDAARISALSRSVFWLVLPSLPLFWVLPALLNAGYSYWSSLFFSCALTVGLYWALVAFLTRHGVPL